MRIGDLFQNVYVINLDEDTARWQQIIEQFKSHGLPAPQRFPAIRGADTSGELREHIRAKRQQASSFDVDGHIGSALSHSTLWKQALASGSKYVTILEDDATFSPALHALRDVELPDDWDFLYLGHVAANAYLKNARSMVPQPKYNASIVRDNFYAFKGDAGDPACGYAYALRPERMRDVIEAYDFQFHADRYIMTFHNKNKFYGVYPNLFVHTYEHGSHTSPLNVTDPYRRVISYLTNHPRHVPFVIPWLLLFAGIVAYTQSLLWSACWVGILGIRCVYDYKALTKKIDVASQRFSNVPGLFGVHYYDPMGNTWDDRGKLKLLDLLRQMHTTCQQSDIRYFLALGTLLGWARHEKRLIPWDDDLDIGVDRRDLARFLELLNASPELRVIEKWSIGCGTFYKIYGPNPHEIWPFIDIFPYDLDATETQISWSWGNWVADVHLPSPLRFSKSTFEGVEVVVAEQWEAMLEAEYGPKWKESCRSSAYCHRYEDEIDPRYAATIESKYLGLGGNIHHASDPT